MYAEVNLYKKFSKFLRLVFHNIAFPPNDITIEISTKCNQRCRACFKFPLKIKEEVMQFEVFQSILMRLKDSSSGKIEYLTFVGLGEIFCHDQLLEILSFTKEIFPYIRINISTNLMSFEENLLRTVIEDKIVDQISLSLDDTETIAPFFHIFSRSLLKNITRLMQLRLQYNPQLKIRLQSIILSRDQTKRIIDFADVYGMDVVHFIRLDLHAFNGEIDLQRVAYKEEQQIIAFARQYSKNRGVRIRYNNSFNIFMKLASYFDKYCLLSDDHIFIDVKGNVLPCFYLRKHSFGNLVKESLSQIYAKKKRKLFYQDQAILCKGCDVYKMKHHH